MVRKIIRKQLKLHPQRAVQPNVTLDCKVPNFKRGNERKQYLTNRKTGIKILTDSFNKLSEK